MAKPGARSKPPRILLIEDSGPMRARLRAILELPPLQAQVLEAENGAVGLRRAMDERPDCILCDMEMPIMNGMTFLRALRAERSAMEAPVVFLTATDAVDLKVAGFQNGASDFVCKPFAPMELVARIGTQVNLCRMQRQLQLAAETDALTGLLNRGSFFPRFESELIRAWRNRRGLALLLLDLDHFKTINDELGHPMGDAVLRDLAALLRRQLRSYDAVARLGGEEFAVLLPDLRAYEALSVAERLRESIAKASLATLEPGRITASFGVTALDPPTPTDTADAVYKRADLDLYDAKRAGRNRVGGGDQAAAAA
jgi:two-component system, cell cycle response regulator